MEGPAHRGLLVRGLLCVRFNLALRRGEHARADLFEQLDCHRRRAVMIIAPGIELDDVGADGGQRNPIRAEMPSAEVVLRTRTFGLLIVLGNWLLWSVRLRNGS